MAQRSKRYKKISENTDSKKEYTLLEALDVLASHKLKFDAGVELHIRLGIDPKKGEQVVRASVTLPAGSPKKKKIAVFSGAEGEELIKKIQETKKIDFDIAVATPDIMRKLAPIAKILGQKGVMPNPKTETVGPDVKKLVDALEKGKVAFKNDDGGNVHILVGRVSWEKSRLKENIETAIKAVQRAKPSSSKGQYMQSMYLASSMGPSLKLKISL